MINNFLKGKTGVFIDSANIYFSQKTLGWKVDFKKLYEYLDSETDLRRASFKGHVALELIKQAKYFDFKKLRPIIELKR